MQQRLTKKQVKTINDLRIQAMLFDMDIDWETASLTERIQDNTPLWLKKWKEIQDASDTRDYDFEH